jgi:hypothetical protein
MVCSSIATAQVWSWLQEIDWNTVAAAAEQARAGGASATPASNLH